METLEKTNGVSGEETGLVEPKKKRLDRRNGERKERPNPTKVADNMMRAIHSESKQNIMRLLTRYFPDLKAFCTLTDRSEVKLRLFLEDAADISLQEYPYAVAILKDIWFHSQRARTWEYLFTGIRIDRLYPVDDSAHIRINGGVINEELHRKIGMPVGAWGAMTKFIEDNTKDAKTKLSLPLFGKNFVQTCIESQPEALFFSFVLNKHDVAAKIEAFLVYLNIITASEIEEEIAKTKVDISHCPFFTADGSIHPDILPPFDFNSEEAEALYGV
jgi:hypothetical protein